MSKTPEFDPDRHYVKIRNMQGVHYEQDGCKFGSGHQYLGRLDGKKEPQQVKEDVRAKAREKIAKAVQKKGNLEGFKEKEAPDAVAAAVKENEAARQAEENA